MQGEDRIFLGSVLARSLIGKVAVRTLLVVLTLACAPYSVPAAQTITLAWDRSSDPNVNGYKVYYGTTRGIYTNVVSVGNVTNAAISGLVEGVSYYFSATACSNLGLESEYSNETSCTIPVGAVLAMKCVRTNGIVAGVTITASGSIPFRWALQSSSNLSHWTTLARGTNVPVNISVGVGSVSSKQFFRLKSE